MFALAVDPEPTGLGQRPRI